MIPVTIRSTGTISEALRKYLSNILENHDVQELNKTATLSTAHTAECTGAQCKGFIVGESVTCAIYCNSRIAAT